MIVEMRTYRLRAGTTAEVEDVYAAVMPARVKLSPLGGFWHSRFGPLDQIVHLWPYADLAERTKIRAEAAKIPGWPPAVLGSIVEQEAAILVPAPFSPPLGERRAGDLYEICTYTYAAGSVASVMQRWGEKIAARMRLSPLIGCWRAELGPLNRLVHIWAYRDLAERERVCAEAVQLGVWPLGADGNALPLKRESVLAEGASFSPLR